MKRIVISILTVLMISVLAACGNDKKEDEHNHSEHKSSDKPQALEVALNVPKEAKSGEEVELSAEVKLGDEKVKDADEVMFEIVKDGDKASSEMKKVKENKEGVYTLKYKFKEAGKYNVTSHVTARDQHTMPNQNINIK
ncbi:FixH family protein [Mammaliicoccus vitulinus]|uniref:FixH family protein n=1 Tax=Mammaliicoccus vitulinus TaxID=71237 RepID=UPI0019500785|nr:FixH family protein [Mammaliicoccus vitulinus]MBM6629845.1 FixH family protein [Mammaliicoccus vitulinus]WQK87475.1 FixH family protein [Mammaliicoccus vitulinus]